MAAFLDAMTLTGALQCGALDEKVLLQLSAVAETTALHALRMLAQRLMPSSSEVALSSPLGAADVGPWLLGAIEAAGNPMQTLPAGPLLAAPPMPSIMAPAMPPPMAPMAPMAPTAAPQSCEQSPGASATAALAADSGVRALFCAALREVSRRRLLPLSNASKLSDVMGSLDGGWAEARKSYAPFSRLLWSFERDVQEAGLALQPCEGGAGFALVEARAEAYQSPSNGGGGGSGGGNGGGDVRGDDARLELAYEARLMGALRDGGWKLLSLLGERERGSPVPSQLRCSLKAFIAARPALLQLAWDADSGELVPVVHQMLRNEGCFTPLRLESVSGCRPGDDEAAGVTELMALVTGHETLTRLSIWNAPFEHAPAQLDALVDATQQACSRVRELEFYVCDFGDSAAALAPLLSATSPLTSLCIRYDGRTQLLGADAAALLADALRSNSTLTTLRLINADLWADPAAGGALFSSLVAHRSLRTLVWREDCKCAHPGLVGVALHALVAADAPALHDLELDVWLDELPGLDPLFAALPCNTHLRCLHVTASFMTPSFARLVLLPAVHANTSLRQLFLPEWLRDFGWPHRTVLEQILGQAAALVGSRR